MYIYKILIIFFLLYKVSFANDYNSNNYQYILINQFKQMSVEDIFLVPNETLEACINEVKRPSKQHLKQCEKHMRNYDDISYILFICIYNESDKLLEILSRNSQFTDIYETVYDIRLKIINKVSKITCSKYRNYYMNPPTKQKYIVALNLEKAKEYLSEKFYEQYVEEIAEKNL